MNKSYLLFPFLALLSCADPQDGTVLFQEAYRAVFESFADLEIKDPSVGRTLAVDLDEDVIRQELNKYHKETLDRTGFDIERSISIWKKHRGKDLSTHVTEEHLHFLDPEDRTIDRVTHVSFSAPVFNGDTSFFFLYMVYETNLENKINRAHQYLMYGKEEGSWIWMMATSLFNEE